MAGETRQLCRNAALLSVSNVVLGVPVDEAHLDFPQGPMITRALEVRGGAERAETLRGSGHAGEGHAQCSG